MKRILLSVFVFFFVFVSVNKTFAQNIRYKYEFGVNIGYLVYQGDLTPETLGSFRTQKLALSLHASKLFSRSFSIRANATIGTLVGNDAVYANPDYRQHRNFYFRTPVAELSGQLVWNLLGRNYSEKRLAPYVFVGAGVSFLTVMPDASRLDENYFDETAELFTGLAFDTIHSTPRVLPVIPVGAGVKYFFSPHWGLNAEASYRITRTDYLDGFSQAANPTKRDKYFGYSVGIIYRTGGKDKLSCPTFKY